jgi:sarcosine oxidase / L-pipecolate oxidase
MTGAMKVVVVGGGALGIGAALELGRRGWAVTVVDPGPLPHPDAASTDISKVIRADYGSDALYTELMELALPRWRQLNARWTASGGRALFHETGFLLLTREPMRPGEFEHDSFALLAARGYPLERLDAAAIARRFPAWAAERFSDGYYNPVGGWAESGAVVAALAADARAAGVTVREGVRFAGFIERGGTVAGVRGASGEALEADAVVLAAGTWTGKLLPELGDRLVSVGQPVMVFRPADARPFEVPAFVPWGADIAKSGWYGFPANAAGLVKVANHGPGRVLDPDAPRALAPDDEPKFRAFLRESLPALAGAPIAFTRLCLYSDAFDGNFFIARHPARPGLTVAAGGSGHAFKFAPALGAIIADALEGHDNPFAARFRWREIGARHSEQARFNG